MNDLFHRPYNEAEAAGGGEDVQGADWELLQRSGHPNNPRQPAAFQIEPPHHLIHPASSRIHSALVNPRLRRLKFRSFSHSLHVRVFVQKESRNKKPLWR